MSFKTATVTMFQLVCDGCEREYEPLPGESPYYDDTAEALADACEDGEWIEVGDKAYCLACWWLCNCGKALPGSPPATGMCDECERNQRGRLIDVTEGYERCPGSGEEIFLGDGPTTARCWSCTARVAIVRKAGRAVIDDHLRLRTFNPIAFEPGTRIRDVWTGAVSEVVKHHPRTGTTELRDTGTDLVQPMNSHNNAHYVAVREAE